MWSVFLHVKAHGRYDKYWKYLKFSSIRMVEKGLHLFWFFFSLKNKDELGDHIFPSQYPKLQNEWSWLVFHDLKCGSSGVRGKRDAAIVGLWFLKQMEWMNNRKLGLNIIWNLKIRIFVLWILSLIVNYGQKMKWNFNGELVDTSSSQSEESSTEFVTCEYLLLLRLLLFLPCI